MKTIQQVKDEHQQKVDDLFRECLVFWAFSKQQFETGKTQLQEGEKYVSIGGGGYMPEGKVKQLREGMAEVEAWYQEAIKDNQIRQQNIAYELANHEAYYTGSIEDTLDELGEDYTAEEVWEVYNRERKKQLH